jgi:hypothetical protein
LTSQFVAKDFAVSTLKILAVGFVLLCALLLSARRFGGRARPWVVAIFLPIWGLACAVNGALGVKGGYSPAVEVFAFALSFGLPAELAVPVTRSA